MGRDFERETVRRGISGTQGTFVKWCEKLAWKERSPVGEVALEEAANKAVGGEYPARLYLLRWGGERGKPFEPRIRRMKR